MFRCWFWVTEEIRELTACGLNPRNHLRQQSFIALVADGTRKLRSVDDAGVRDDQLVGNVVVRSDHCICVQHLIADAAWHLVPALRFRQLREFNRKVGIAVIVEGRPV